MNENNRCTRSKDSQSTTSSNSTIGNISPTDNRKRGKKPLTRPHETEEEATVRRFHDAQRMARFRAKRRKASEEAKAIETSKLTEIALITELRRRNVDFEITNCVAPVVHQFQDNNNSIRIPESRKKVTSLATISLVNGNSKYSQLLSIIEELGRDIKLSYAGGRSSAERLKMGIVQARNLVRDCLLETEVNSRQ